MKFLALVSAFCFSFSALSQTLIVDGDSLFSWNEGVPCWTNYWTNSGMPIENHAESGKPISEILSSLATNDYLKGRSNCFFLLEGGHGDLNAGRTAEELKADTQEIIRRARHIRFWVCTVPASPFLLREKEVERQKYNTWVRENLPCLDLDTLVPLDIEGLHTGYRQDDHLHFSDQSEQWLAAWICQLISSPASVSKK